MSAYLSIDIAHGSNRVPVANTMDGATRRQYIFPKSVGPRGWVRDRSVDG